MYSVELVEAIECEDLRLFCSGFAVERPETVFYFIAGLRWQCDVNKQRNVWRHNSSIATSWHVSSACMHPVSNLLCCCAHRKSRCPDDWWLINPAKFLWSMNPLIVSDRHWSHWPVELRLFWRMKLRSLFSFAACLPTAMAVSSILRCDSRTTHMRFLSQKL